MSDETPETTPVATSTGADVPPDHLAISPRSPFFDEDVLMRGVGIRFKGVVRTNVEEYSISEGWIRVAAGKSRDRFGQPMTIKLKGTVEPFYNGPDAAGDEAGPGADAEV